VDLPVLPSPYFVAERSHQSDLDVSSSGSSHPSIGDHISEEKQVSFKRATFGNVETSY
jgi:hypothetical protein